MVCHQQRQWLYNLKVWEKGWFKIQSDQSSHHLLQIFPIPMWVCLKLKGQVQIWNHSNRKYQNYPWDFEGFRRTHMNHPMRKLEYPTLAGWKPCVSLVNLHKIASSVELYDDIARKKNRKSYEIWWTLIKIDPIHQEMFCYFWAPIRPHLWRSIQDEAANLPDVENPSVVDDSPTLE